MQKLSITLFLSPLFLLSYSQAPNWAWAKSAGGNDDDKASSIATDALGNVYVTGNFGGGYIHFGSTALANSGGSDVFLAKYDAAGNALWARSATGSNDDQANSVAIDALGNVYVTGNFLSSPLIFGTDTIFSGGTYNIFLVKYDTAGNVLWAKSEGGGGYDEALSVATDALGNAYLAGYFTGGSIAFDSLMLTNVSANTSDIYLAKYDAAGNVLWVKGAGE